VYVVLLLLVVVVVGAMSLTTRLQESKARVISLSRFAIKGLDPDQLSEVTLERGASMPFDRRWALRAVSGEAWDGTNWIHKSNFLCKFTATHALPRFLTRFDDQTLTLSVWERGETTSEHEAVQSAPACFRLSDPDGKAALETFFSKVYGQPLVLEDGGVAFQFGNTNAGLGANGNTRTLHIVNAETCREVSEAVGAEIDPMRFRPNIVIDGLRPWEEFEWVGRSVVIGGVELDVIKRTVRCKGVNVDRSEYIDIPEVLQEKFPDKGPYLGVYAQTTAGGFMRLGDAVRAQSA